MHDVIIRHIMNLMSLFVMLYCITSFFGSWLKTFRTQIKKKLVHPFIIVCTTVLENMIRVQGAQMIHDYKR
jgi:fumarate reductase subunit C